MNKKNPIDHLYVWVVQQENGVEKIATPRMFNDTYPLVSSSKKLATERMSTWAKTVEQETGYPTKLVKFVRVGVME